MPSALETLVKMLKLEREQGFKNTAVIGGLGAYSTKWKYDASTQARKPEHNALVEELFDILSVYEEFDAGERSNKVNYMLDRITGRKPPPPEYQARIAEARAHQAADEAVRELSQASGEADHPTETPAPEPLLTASSTPAVHEAPRREKRDRERNKRNRDREQQPSDDAQPQNAQPHETQRDQQRDQRPQRDQQRDNQQRDQRLPQQRDQQPREAQREQRPPQNQNRDPQRENRDAQAHGQGRDQRPPQNQQNQRGGSGGQPNQQRPPRPQHQHQPMPKSGKSDGESSLIRDEDFAAPELDVNGNRKPVKSDIPAVPRLARPPRKARKPMDVTAAADIMRGLSASVSTVNGVGPKMAIMLNKLGIYTINDLLFFLPRRYDDYTKLSQISKLQPNVLATVIGTVRHTEMRIARGGRKDFFIVVDDGTASMGVTFFGQYYLNRQVRAEQQVVLRGQTSMFQNKIQMTNPEIQLVEQEDLQRVGIVPVYPLTDGLNMRSMRKLIRKTVEFWADHLQDYMPEGTLDRAEMADIGWAIQNMHFPESWDHLEHAQRRYIFDQLLLMQLTIMANRRTWQSVPSQQLGVGDEKLQAFLDAVFPFPLTGAQRRAIEDVRADMARPVPMNRLLQGDVGSGKTAVAATMLAVALMSGKQGALMVPTSILAEQHYRNLSAAFARMPAELMPREGKPVIALLTGSVSTSDREAIYRGLADGSIDIVIGTHAIIQDGVEFNNLAAAIIDEQHRFGVEQRGALRGKGTNPHLLVMTATPIPRTLALTLFADLDLTIIDEMPPGRIPIRTRVIEPPQRERAYNFVEEQLEEGRQAFIVYPLVEASETIDAQSAVEAYDQLTKVFYKHKVGLLHGRMKPAEKDAIMEGFRSHQFDVLVTTSVAEVGVDIPNASIIVIDGANRFGLAQLHQFRGRVGRGGHASYCLLVCDTLLEDARERLMALEQTNDGFKLAEIDWKLRGPGDLIGTRQSGQAQLQLLEQMKPELVELAQREARTIFEDDPELTSADHRLLRERIEQLQNARSDVS